MAPDTAFQVMVTPVAVKLVAVKAVGMPQLVAAAVVVKATAVA